MTIEQILNFLKLVECKKFSTAAEALYISQSSLSKRIKSLEDECQKPLICHGKNPIKLTAEGESFLQFAIVVEKEYRQLMKTISAHPENKIVINTIPSMLSALFQVIPGFNEIYPDIEVIIHEQPVSELFKEDINADLYYTREYHVPDTGFSKIPLTSMNLVLATSPSHHLAECDVIALRDLRDENLIMIHQSSTHLIDLCRKHGFRPKIRHNVTSVEALLHFIKAEDGGGFLYSPVDRQDPTYRHYYEGLHIIELSDSITEESCFFYRPETLSGPSKLFLEYIKKHRLSPESVL